MGCEVFLGERAEPRMEPKKIIHKKVVLKSKIQAYHKPESKSVSIHDILKKKGGE